ncbi:MAG: CDP-alcohol phosphatidyltransferase family protein [Candidatus Korarchaeota archaeon]|nr:CDP-alcohol phosphatidyltransferase family protein [Candidatus Korarchaeota archaeon]NIU82823.1 hypothetical protein [Candidatus Thorarchaeota archaeon]NIW13309.1 hypothetical protein [Candidatus Thorarchaeota archaeon]NIW51415.1 hypothetical protein [Candidatus Korarchaeota archaeon]
MSKRFWNPANSISLGRIPFLFGIVALILLPPLESVFYQRIAVVLIAILFLLDQVDGYVARKTGSTTKIGAMVDIMVDRIVELILWVTVAFVGYAPVWVPFVFISRGLITDTIRSEVYRKGLTPYEMIQSKVGKIIVSSHISRGIYAVLKAFTFCYVLAVPAFGVPEIWAPILVYASTIYCIVRGIPVIADARHVFSEEKIE